MADTVQSEDTHSHISRKRSASDSHVLRRLSVPYSQNDRFSKAISSRKSKEESLDVGCGNLTRDLSKPFTVTPGSLRERMSAADRARFAPYMQDPNSIEVHFEQILREPAPAFVRLAEVFSAAQAAENGDLRRSSVDERPSKTDLPLNPEERFLRNLQSIAAESLREDEHLNIECRESLTLSLHSDSFKTLKAIDKNKEVRLNFYDDGSIDATAPSQIVKMFVDTIHKLQPVPFADDLPLESKGGFDVHKREESRHLKEREEMELEPRHHAPLPF